MTSVVPSPLSWNAQRHRCPPGWAHSTSSSSSTAVAVSVIVYGTPYFRMATRNRSPTASRCGPLTFGRTVPDPSAS